MAEMDDRKLLCDYVANGSEEAFAELVHRHVDMVYSVAWRRLNDVRDAQEVAQSVFCLLAQKARHLSPGALLGPWLYRTTCYKCTEYSRSERRRWAREREALDSINTPPEAEIAWHQLVPLLDDAVQHLKDADRQAIVLRFFERKSLRDVGHALRLDEDAARKRVSRTVDKLRDWFEKRGITCSASVLSASLLAFAVRTAPAGMAATLVKVALATASISASPLLINLLTPMIAKKIATAAVILTAIATPPALLWRENHHLREEMAELRVTVAENDQIRSENALLASRQNDANQLKSAQTEVARLRNLVTQLRHSISAPSEHPPIARTNALPAESTNLLHSFHSSVKARITAGQTLTVGGWAHQPGKRLISLVKPDIEALPNTSGQILITTTFVEIPDDIWNRLGLDSPTSNPGQNPLQLMLNNDQSKDFLNMLTNQAGVTILSSPRLETSDGVNAKISTANSQRDSIQSFLVKPHLSPNSQEVDLEMEMEVVSSANPARDTDQATGDDPPPN